MNFLSLIIFKPSLFKNKNRIFIATLGLVLSLITSPLWAGELRFFNQDPRFPITFGLEIEVNPSLATEFSKILRFYKPLHIEAEAWAHLHLEARYALFSKIHGAHLILMDEKDIPMDEQTREFYRSLPPSLYREGSGHYEFNGSIYGDLDQVKSFLAQFRNYFYEGDVQGHVVFDSHSLKGATGYTIYEHDRALLRRLEEEFENYEREPIPENIPGINFLAAYLGPLNEYHKQEVINLESELEYYPNSQSYKRVSRMAGPALRNIGYPKGKYGFELRMEDNPSFASVPYRGSFVRIVEAMDRLSYVLSAYGSLSPFISFNEVELTEEFHFDFYTADQISRNRNHGNLANYSEFDPNYLPLLEVYQTKLRLYQI